MSELKDELQQTMQLHRENQKVGLKIIMNIKQLHNRPYNSNT